jgi:DNA-binding transcriptional LysR family regulator
MKTKQMRPPAGAVSHDLLRSFLAAADAPTFADAARARGVTKAAISQQMKALEWQLGVALFERVGRRARLTGSGVELRAAVTPALDAVDVAIEAARAESAAVAGEIRIGAPRPFARVWLRPRLARLLEAHASLSATVVFGTPTELERKLVDGVLDFVLLARASELPGVAAAHVYTERYALYASPRYLAADGAPSTAAECASHRFVVWGDDLPMHGAWWRATFGAREKMRGAFVCKVASLDEMRALAESGIGLVVLPDYFASDALAAKTLVEIDVGSRTRKAQNPLFLAHRERSVQNARFVAVRDALLAR